MAMREVDWLGAAQVPVLLLMDMQEIQMDHEMEEDELHLSNQQIQLGNITVDSVREHILGEEFIITVAELLFTEHATPD